VLDIPRTSPQLNCHNSGQAEPLPVEQVFHPIDGGVAGGTAGRAGKYRMTSGPTFIAAYGSRSLCRQRRITSRAVCTVSNRRSNRPA
jgi:hypothetical protein